MKKQIGVIFGSRSCEREVAIISAIQLMRNADTEKYDVIPVYIDEHGNWYTGEKLKDIATFRPFRGETSGIVRVFPDLTAGSGALLRLEKGKGLFSREKLEIAARIDVYVVVMHGLNGEDGTLQGLLELANVPYTSTGVPGSAIGMDKIMMKQFFRGRISVTTVLSSSPPISKRTSSPTAGFTPCSLKMPLALHLYTVSPDFT